MRHIAVTTLLLLGGCALTADQVSDTENSLSAAGFQVRPASTPQRQAMLATLPPNRLVQQVGGQTVSYLYADPRVCHCLYAGDQTAFARYQQDRQAHQIASEQLQAAQLRADTWDWGPWGGGGFGGFGGGFGGAGFGERF